MSDKENTFIKMFNEGWCTDCDFDAAKCAEQGECESCKKFEKKINEEEIDIEKII